MKQTLPDASIRRIAKVLQVARSSLARKAGPAGVSPKRNRRLEKRIKKLIRTYPTVGSRRIWAMLRRSGGTVNKKTVYRIFKLNGWFVKNRIATPRDHAQRAGEAS